MSSHELTDKILRYKEKVADAEREETRLTAQIDMQKERLKKEHGCNSLREAEKKNKELASEIEEKQKEFNNKLSEVEKKYKWD